MITLVQTGTPIDSIWETLLTLSQRQANGWTLIGAHMVALHALEQGRTPPRRSEDIDVLVNVRAMQGGTRKLSQVLLELGFLLDPPNPEGVSHRFRNQRLSIDLLAPDGISERTSRTTVPPARTVMVPGGTQALQRTETVQVELGDLRGAIPRPSLLGAIVLKACAIGVDDAPDAQRIDVAFLLTLVNRPRELHASLTTKDRQRLRACVELLDPRHPAWLNVEQPQVGLRALRILLF